MSCLPLRHNRLRLSFPLSECGGWRNGPNVNRRIRRIHNTVLPAFVVPRCSYRNLIHWEGRPWWEVRVRMEEHVERILACWIWNIRFERWRPKIQRFPPRCFSWLQWMKSKEVNTGVTGLEWTVFAVSVRAASTTWAHIVKWTILEIQPPRKTADTSR